MKNKTPWYKWPNNVNPSIKPWYSIARTLLFLPLCLTGFSLMYLGLLGGQGVDMAEDFRKDWF